MHSAAGENLTYQISVAGFAVGFERDHVARCSSVNFEQDVPYARAAGVCSPAVHLLIEILPLASFRASSGKTADRAYARRDDKHRVSLNHNGDGEGPDGHLLEALFLVELEGVAPFGCRRLATASRRPARVKLR
ncbi:MAG: hypothetical protein AB8H80_08630 [Planctomycetota bacterium]